jgi:hypothetical protein
VEAVGVLELGDVERGGPLGPERGEAVDADLADGEQENSALVGGGVVVQGERDRTAVSVESGDAQSHTRGGRVFKTRGAGRV